MVTTDGGEDDSSRRRVLPPDLVKALAAASSAAAAAAQFPVPTQALAIMQRALAAVAVEQDVVDRVVTQALAGLNTEYLSSHISAAAAAAQAAAFNANWYPPNWPQGTFPDAAILNTILREEGIPLVWVPPQHIVEDLISAQTRVDRVGILMAAREEILASCETLVDSLPMATMPQQIPLAKSAVRLARSGETDGAQSLAVLVAERLIKSFVPGKFAAVRTTVDLDVDEVAFGNLKVAAAFMPVVSFFTEFRPGQVAPSQLNRHVTVHLAGQDHFTDENSLISIMLLVSILKAVTS